MRQASLSVISLAAWCAFGTTGLSAEKAVTVQAPPQLQAAVARLTALPAMSHRPVYHIDPLPSVEVGGQRGYRIVLRQTWKEPRPGDERQLPPTEEELKDPAFRANWLTKHADWHFVLVPVGKEKLPDDAKRDILWPVPDEKEFRLPIALGEGHGFAWFTYTSLPMQHFVREQLKLTGGDDPLQLALLGLSFQGQPLGELFEEFGDKGFAALNQVTWLGDDEHSTVRKCNAIRSMTSFHDAPATARLVNLYFSSPNNPWVKQAAATALISEPLRPEASRVYIDMIGGYGRTTEAMEICAELGLKDALPAIEAIVEKPSSLYLYLRAYEAYRKLSGKPIDAKLIEAKEVLMKQAGTEPETRPKPEELALARRTIAESPDVDGAAYLAFSLVAFQTKGRTMPTTKDGIAILQKLPRPIVENLCNRLLKNDNGSIHIEPITVLEVSRQVLGTGETER
jgi:hypothetical protein